MFKKRKFQLLGLAALMTVLGSVVISCGDDTAATQSYTGPGSEFGIVLNGDGTFVVTKKSSIGGTTTLTVNGTYSRLSTGFVKLTVTSSDPVDQVPAGETAYGLEIPGLAFLLKPAGSDANIIPMVVSGDCPTADMSMNWIQVETDDSQIATSTSSDYYGTFTYTHSTTSASLPAKYNLVNTTSLGSSSIGTLTCSAGTATVSGADMFLTGQGGAIVHTNTSSTSADGMIVAMPNGTLTTTTALEGSYSGLVFDKAQTSSGSNANRIFPVSVTLTASTSTTITGVATKFSDVETLPTVASDATLSLTSVDSPSAGFIRGTITIASSTTNLVCMAKTDVVGSGKNMLFCIGQSPNSSTKHFNILLVSR